MHGKNQGRYLFGITAKRLLVAGEAQAAKSKNACEWKKLTSFDNLPLTVRLAVDTAAPDEFSALQETQPASCADTRGMVKKYRSPSSDTRLFRAAEPFTSHVI